MYSNKNHAKFFMLRKKNYFSLIHNRELIIRSGYITNTISGFLKKYPLL